MSIKNKDAIKSVKFQSVTALLKTCLKNLQNPKEIKMKQSKYTIFKAYNFLMMLYNRPRIKQNLVKLYKYHRNSESFDFNKTKQVLLNGILEYSQTHCPYYQQLYKRNKINISNFEHFEKIPFLSKEIIRLNYNSLQSADIKKVTNYIMNTGGTTGTPLTFPVSSHQEYEHHEFAFKLYGYEKGDEIVSFDGIAVSEDKIKKNIFWKQMSRTNLPYGKISFSTLYLNNETALTYINELNNIKPAFIRGYPSAINYLAVYILENKIQLDFDLKGVFLTAETIFPNQISSIKNAFKCPVGLEYGHSEVSVFAYTVDNTYEYYCSPFYGYTEIIDTDGMHVDIGEVGEIVVTGFYNKAMPFIRYKTGDMALYNGNKDGLTRLTRIDGRTQDYVLDKNENKVFLVGLIYGGHHSFLDHIKKWQIIQDKPGFIDIKIIKGKGFSFTDESSIVELFIKNDGIKSNIEFVSEIGFTSSGKNKFVIQNAVN